MALDSSAGKENNYMTPNITKQYQKINAAIWHLCPLPVNNDVLHAMIILPECTYANDCTVVEFEEKDWFKIV